MINVLIVEDDPMVAEFNKRYLKEIDGFFLVGVAHSVNEATKIINSKKVDLMLLDVYMPGENGLTLLSKIREEKRELDVILITAASDVDKILTALRYGAVDYLIKPFEFERFQQALTSYQNKHLYLNQQSKMKQKDLDELLLAKQNEYAVAEPLKPLPKGLSRKTLNTVFDAVKRQGNTPFSTDEIAEVTDISRVSIRKYLKFLNDIYVIDKTLTYGIGRPLYSYMYNESNRSALDKYE
ncbi:response regulator (plasmid) [Bacillus sp. CMF21]|uniref:response regulator n=1 Tax=Metabacillus dongyingensis TaxID=2874282 RepID=UPI001FB2654C|nr:response regulator [Metabacillus dongyingensis]UNJ81216.1 Two-component response regulator, malate [Metabacillus dongyingensis]USK31189.1 response regulator [Bacillus sp. CMF21]